VYPPLDAAFNHFNAELYGGKLPRCLLSIRAKGKTLGFYAPKRIASLEDPTVLIDEIALNAACFSKRSLLSSASTLVHEMSHHQQEHFGTPPRSGYHDVEWAGMMLKVGLTPSDTGAPGGKQTGYHMSDYVIEGGPFARSFERLVATGWTIGWGDAASPATIDPAFVEGGIAVEGRRRTRESFRCERCRMTAESRASAELVCLPCALAARPDLADFLPQFKFKLKERNGVRRVFACSAPLLPAWVEKRLETAPEHSDRRGIAQIHTELFGPISPRSLEDWPLAWKLVAGKAVANTRDAITYAYERFQAAPRYRTKRTAGAA
jgi:hypothetical protein